MISDYTWRYKVSQNFLGFNEKRYEYGHLPYNTNNYREARRTCMEKGIAWDLASFQTNFSSSVGNIQKDNNYFHSMANLKLVGASLQDE